LGGGLVLIDSKELAIPADSLGERMTFYHQELRAEIYRFSNRLDYARYPREHLG
jgi:hypothetical protein